MGEMSNKKSVGKNKKYLIIPAAGKSSRYSTKKPKYLLTHPHGKLMIQEVISGLDLDLYEECHIVLLKEHCDKYEADVIIEQSLGPRFKITVLENPTRSSPETVVECVKRNSITGQIVVKDCDCYVSFDEPESDNYVIGLDIHDMPVKNITSKSFIVSENDILKDIVEKKVVSDIVCLGVYSIHSDSLLSIFEELVNYTDKEIYFSHLISLCSERGTIFEVKTTKEYIDWGTSDEWFEYTSNLRTYIFDIDGVFLENTGRYGTKNWNNTFIPLQSNVDVLKRLSDNGSEIIFVTSRTEDCLDQFKRYLNKMGIVYKTIISGCNHNKRILINDFSPTNPYPSCESVNVPRNGSLGDYL